MQLQADLLDRPVTRSDVTGVGAMGAAAMAFSGLGIETGLEHAGQARVFAPVMAPDQRAAILAGWHSALRRVLA